MMRKPWAATPPSLLALTASPPPTHSLGLLQGLRLLTSLPHWLFLGLLRGQQFKLCLHLPLEKGETSSALPWLSPGSTHAGSLSYPGHTHREAVDLASRVCELLSPQAVPSSVSSASSWQPEPPAAPAPRPQASAASLQATSPSSGGSETGCTSALRHRGPAAPSRTWGPGPPRTMSGSCSSRDPASPELSGLGRRSRSIWARWRGCSRAGL